MRGGQAIGQVTWKSSWDRQAHLMDKCKCERMVQ